MDEIEQLAFDRGKRIAELEAKVERLKREKVEAQSKAFHAEAKCERLERAIKAVTQYRSHCTSGDDVRCLVPIRFINELAALEGGQDG